MYYNLINSMSRGGSYDADAQAFLTATAITDLTISNAINNLVLGLKANNIWNKMKAIYPFVGGTAFTHKFNLKDPRDLDVAFRLTYTGTQVHSSNGITSNNHIDTHFTPSTNLSLDSAHLSFYSRTNNSGNNVEMGVYNETSALFIAPNYGGSSYRAVNNPQLGPGTGINMQAFLIASRITSTASKLYRNTTVAFNDTVTSSFLMNISIYLFGYNNGSITWEVSNQQCAFSSIGDGLTDTESSNLYAIVQAFQTALSRNV